MNSKTILLVEDDDAIRETFKLALEINGYSVVTASNGKIGIEELSKMPRPCLILLDLMMPVMDGWGFVKELDLNKTYGSIPIVAVTAFSDKAKAISVKKVIKKPVDLELLLAIAREYCGNSCASEI